MIRCFAAASALLFLAAGAASAQPRPPSPDTNKDGVISRAEHIAASGRGFARMDANKDGVLSPEEIARVTKMLGGRNILGPADLDKDGKITTAEFTRASNYRFDQADANKDGNLDTAEQATLRAQRGG